MGLFGVQAKADERLEYRSFEEDEHMEHLPVPPRSRSNTIITKGITVAGTLRGEGVVQVEGNVEGEIDLKGSVIVAVGGAIKGPVSADVVQIAGQVEGNVTGHKHLRLEKTGAVDGDLATPSLVVEDGGRLNGRTTMIQTQPEPLPSYDQFPQTDRLDFGPNYQPEEDV